MILDHLWEMKMVKDEGWYLEAQKESRERGQSSRRETAHRGLELYQDGHEVHQRWDAW